MVESLTPLESLEEVVKFAPDEKAVIETDLGIYVVEVWEGDSTQVSTYLQQVNEEWILAQKPEVFSTLVEQHTIIFFSKELVEVETEIHTLFGKLETTPIKEQPRQATSKPVVNQESTANRAMPTIDIRSQRPIAFDKHQMPPLPKEAGSMPSSIFSLAAKVYTQERHKAAEKAEVQGKTTKQEGSTLLVTAGIRKEETQELDLKREREGSGQGKQDREQEKEDQRKEQQKRFKVEAAKTEGKKGEPTINTICNDGLQGMENIYVRFMALMARILGQAEAEAHDLYNKIKARTDKIDLLTTLIQKINSSSGGVDWEKDVQMRKLIDQVRECGVEIPPGKYSWAEDEKILLKENIQMRKDSMEKITQLERTDMQRYLQEASQCHQARSNILKLLKEVVDTVIYNLRS